MLTGVRSYRHLARYAARNENFVLVCVERHNALGAPKARPPERPAFAPQALRRVRRSFSGGGSGACGVPASDGDRGSGGAKPPGLGLARVARSSAGFTLIELLIVLALISILAAMGVVQYRNGVRHTQESVLRTDLFRMRDAIDQYYADKNKYPASLEALVSDGYMRRIPEDPITKSADTWQTVPAEPDPTNPTAEPGVYDVKSGAQGTALDGSTYTDW
jgi:general secretion pathway protein G